jgi:hypothetical protein
VVGLVLKVSWFYLKQHILSPLAAAVQGQQVLAIALAQKQWWGQILSFSV